MTIRNLDKLLSPKSVAVIGASPEPATVGAIVTANLAAGGFAGPLWLVNPHHKSINGDALLCDACGSSRRARSRGHRHAAADDPCAHRRAWRQGNARGRRHHRGHRRRPSPPDAARRRSPTACASRVPTASGSCCRASGSMPASARPCRSRATWRSCRNRARSSPRSSIGRRRAASASPRSSPWATWRTSISATARLPRRRRGEPRHPALHGAADAGAEVPLGRAPGRARQTRDRVEGGAQQDRGESSHVAHGRARGLGCGLQRHFPPRRPLPRQGAWGAVRGGRDPLIRRRTCRASA